MQISITHQSSALRRHEELHPLVEDLDPFIVSRDSIFYWPAMAGCVVLGCGFIYAICVAVPLMGWVMNGGLG